MRHLHLHVRKRLEPYPSRNFWKRLLDMTVYAVGVFGPIVTIPQVYKIYAAQSAGDISAFSWGMLALFNIPWIIYGFVHKENPIIVTNLLWFGLNIAVCVGAVLYG